MNILQGTGLDAAGLREPRVGRGSGTALIHSRAKFLFKKLLAHSFSYKVSFVFMAFEKK
jgi:hypothetical protein